MCDHTDCARERLRAVWNGCEVGDMHVTTAECDEVSKWSSSRVSVASVNIKVRLFRAVCVLSS